MTMSTGSGVRSRERTRQRLLDAAAEVFAETGLDAASVELICERAGFTRGAFYSNFASKSELFLELARSVAHERLAAVEVRVRELSEEAVAEGESFDLHRIVMSVMDSSMSTGLGIRLMSEIRNHALRDASLAHAYLRQEDELRTRVGAIIEQVVSDHGYRLRLSSEAAATLMLSVWDSIAVRLAMSEAADADIAVIAGQEVARLGEILLDRD